MFEEENDNMTIDVAKFAAFVSRISSITAYVFKPRQCAEMLDSIQYMNNEVTVPAMPIMANPLVLNDLMKNMVEGTQKIEAIKNYRTLTGLGLKEAKDAVERYWLSKPFEQRLGPAVSN